MTEPEGRVFVFYYYITNITAVKHFEFRTVVDGAAACRYNGRKEGMP